MDGLLGLRGHEGIGVAEQQLHLLVEAGATFAHLAQRVGGGRAGLGVRAGGEPAHLKRETGGRGEPRGKFRFHDFRPSFFSKPGRFPGFLEVV